MKRASGLALPWEISLLKAILLFLQMAVLLVLPFLPLPPSFPNSCEDVLRAARPGWALHGLISVEVGGDLRGSTLLGSGRGWRRGWTMPNLSRCCCLALEGALEFAFQGWSQLDYW